MAEEQMIDWTKQHCGVHQAPIEVAKKLMPDLRALLDTFPAIQAEFTWDIKVHMLMPRQYACIPNWHRDFVPRVNGIQRHDLCTPELPMYLWVSGAPLVQFRDGYVPAATWHRFTQLDEHRGTQADDFRWRGFIRATHRSILVPKKTGHLRRHTQVYLDANEFTW
jgi:hypothetical protein